MMNLIETIGNIKIYRTKSGREDYTITLINGGEIIAQDRYITSDPIRAAEDMMQKVLDTYTEDYVFLCVPGVERLSENTYKLGNNDWFCRISGTRYFKHYLKSADEFIWDKKGLRIIDK